MIGKPIWTHCPRTAPQSKARIDWGTYRRPVRKLEETMRISQVTFHKHSNTRPTRALKPSSQQGTLFGAGETYMKVKICELYSIKVWRQAGSKLPAAYALFLLAC
eukprot:5190981-Pyramimonas_sp.AAC.1